MVWKFTIILLISILLLFSLKKCQKKFDSVELFILFMFISYFFQEVFFILTSPYQRFRVVEEHLPFWASKLQYGIIFPILLIWFIYFLRNNNRLSSILFISFIWIISVVLIEKILLEIGIMMSNSESWYPEIEFVFAFFILFISCFFTELLLPLLKKEKIMPWKNGMM